MASEIPPSTDYSGHSRTVLRFGEIFQGILAQIKQPNFSPDAWAPLEELVDLDNFERVGRFLTPEAEVIGWDKYKYYITQFGGGTVFEGKLRGLTEDGNRVIQLLGERNIRDGVADRSNTVTIFDFNDAGKLHYLEVYAMHLGKEPAE